MNNLTFVWTRVKKERFVFAASNYQLILKPFCWNVSRSFSVAHWDDTSCRWCTTHVDLGVALRALIVSLHVTLDAIQKFGVWKVSSKISAILTSKIRVFGKGAVLVTIHFNILDGMWPRHKRVSNSQPARYKVNAVTTEPTQPVFLQFEIVCMNTQSW